MSAASENLRNNQEQADMDGCMVKVSRQAVDETLAELEDLKHAALMLLDECGPTKTPSLGAVARLKQAVKQ